MTDVAIALGLLACGVVLGVGYALGHHIASRNGVNGHVGSNLSVDPLVSTDAEQAVARLRSDYERFREALNACDTASRRLTWLAEKDRDVATSLRQCHGLGLVPSPTGRIDAGWQAPYELRRDGRRDPIAEWQAVDRALEALAATLDDPASDLEARARVFEGLAEAAMRVVGATGESPLVSELALCTFYGKRAPNVRKVIAGPPGALICEDCVDLCVEILEEEIGEEWRQTGTGE